MAKRRKTKEQKKLADSRHQFHHQASTPVFELKPSNIQVAEIKAKKSIPEYPYLIKDLTKTSILSFSIIGFQIVLFFILKNHLIKIPGISY